MGDNNYFQFPLCALAFCDSERERLDQLRTANGFIG